jgi:hypothetical protein
VPQPTHIVSTPTPRSSVPYTRYAWMLGDVELDNIDIDNREPPIAVLANITEMFVEAALEAEGEQPDAEHQHHRGAKRHLLRPGWVADLPEQYRCLTAGLIKLKMEQARCTHTRYERALDLTPSQWSAECELTADEQAMCAEYHVAYDQYLDSLPSWRSADGSASHANDPDAQVEE